MGLAQVQAALAALATQADARAAFAGDPEAWGRARGLDAADAAALAALAPRALNRFAGSLKAKRRLDAQKLLPLTARALGDSFAPRLREVLVEPPPGATADALALAEHLAREPRGLAPWIVDLARYEGAFVRAWRPGFVFRILRFRHPVAMIAARLGQGEHVGAVPSRPTFGAWARWPGGRLWHRTWTPARRVG